MRETREPLLEALRQYRAASSDAELELAVLALHQRLQGALSAYLESHGSGEVDAEGSFPRLVDLVRDRTDLFQGDEGVVRLLVSLNTTRNRIAHPQGDKPLTHEIERDARQLARLISRFWPAWFDETCPVSATRPQPRPEPEPADHRTPEWPRRPPSSESALRSPEPSKFGHFLRNVWVDESQPRLRVGLLFLRLIGIALLLLLAQGCKSGAISTARWPAPIKHIGIALILAALGFLVWSLIVVWRVLGQLRLKRLLILLGIAYVLVLVVSLLTAQSPRPFFQQVWWTTRQTFSFVGRQVRDGALTVVGTPQEFRLAYTGHRRPIRLPGMDAEDTSYLTPIPANRPARQESGARPVDTPTPLPVDSAQDTPTPRPETTRTATVTGEASPTPAAPPTEAGPTAASLPLPDCPHSQARLTVPRVGEVIADQIQVQGSANIENQEYFKFEFRREDGQVEDEWHWAARYDELVEEGVLGTWDVSHLPEGVYTFRLVVVNVQGNYPFPPCEVSVRVQR